MSHIPGLPPEKPSQPDQQPRRRALPLSNKGTRRSLVKSEDKFRFQQVFVQLNPKLTRMWVYVQGASGQTPSINRQSNDSQPLR